MNFDKDRVWRSISEGNPWWQGESVPAALNPETQRTALPVVWNFYRRVSESEGLVLLGPRRVGKTVLMHQLVAALLAEGIDPKSICVMTLDDPTLRGAELGLLLELLEARQPFDGARWLLIDEIQHSDQWSGWLKNVADRGRPYRFFATGSSATALRHGSQDAGVGRWREMLLLPWSFYEHVSLRGDLETPWTFRVAQRARDPEVSIEEAIAEDEAPSLKESQLLNDALLDYFVRGGFPQAATDEVHKAQRTLREDIFYRSLGRDISDAETRVDTRLLEKLILRIAQQPGQYWNTSNVAGELQRSRSTIDRHLDILERAFLVFRLRNVASRVRGQPKVYLVAPALRSALLHLSEQDVNHPDEWGRMAESAVASQFLWQSSLAIDFGFWRKHQAECDFVLERKDRVSLYEVKRGGSRGRPKKGISAAWNDLQRRKKPGTAMVLTHDELSKVEHMTEDLTCQYSPLAAWLMIQSATIPTVLPTLQG